MHAAAPPLLVHSADVTGQRWTCHTSMAVGMQCSNDEAGCHADAHTKRFQSPRSSVRFCLPPAARHHYERPSDGPEATDQLRDHCRSICPHEYSYRSVGSGRLSACTPQTPGILTTAAHRDLTPRLPALLVEFLQALDANGRSPNVVVSPEASDRR